MKLLQLKVFFGNRWVRWTLFIILMLGAFGVGRLSALDGVDGNAEGNRRLQRAQNRARIKADTAQDVADAIARLAEDPSSMTEEALAQLAKMVDRTQAQELLAALANLPAHQREHLTRVFMEAWSAKDPAGAIAALRVMEPGRLSYSLMERALANWGERDPQAAIKWLSENRGVEPSNVFAQRLQHVLRGWAEKDPQSALQFALTEMPSGTRSTDMQQAQAVRSIAAAMARSGNIDEALTLFSSLPEGNLRNSALNSVAREWGRNDPQSALQWTQTLGSDGDNLRSTIMRSWSEQDPASAAQWVAGLDSSEGKKAEWMAEAVAQWSRYDLETPATWLNSLPNSPEKDGAVLAFTNRAAQEDPQGALAWASQVSNSEWRDRAMAMVGVQWSRENPEEFKSYVQTATDLSAQQRALMQNISENGMRAIFQMGMPKTGITGGSFHPEQLRSIGFGGPGGRRMR